MTYPPQQPPGQGGWGQQPGGHYPPSGPQQPGGAYPPSGGQPQPGYGQQGYPQPGGGYPQSGPQPQQGYGQQPPYPPQGGGYGQPGFGAEPPKKKSPLPWILGGVGGLVVIGVVIALIVVFTGGPGDPRNTAQDLVDKMNSKDFAGLATLSCEKEKAKLQESLDQLQGKGNLEELKEIGLTEADIQKLLEGVKFNVKLGEVKDNGDETATAKISGELTMTGEIMGQQLNESQPLDEEFKMIVENGDWKFCDGFA
ncbi:DUF2076 domain-containing protein [Saccharopolyspora sp. K220]|uniref:DUF2076 domain-containing protein n=1 Tax=Saccharopolyspora soli TaxID=2926618 RepID=UPI001F587753|nr:DUF2076 domain-containing protein [Saccharopolyspora soli]MCI2418464.1 DUF2076 domain-containing protein [Saccharopolyspora soli]